MATSKENRVFFQSVATGFVCFADVFSIWLWLFFFPYWNGSLGRSGRGVPRRSHRGRVSAGRRTGVEPQHQTRRPVGAAEHADALRSGPPHRRGNRFC